MYVMYFVNVVHCKLHIIWITWWWSRTLSYFGYCATNGFVVTPPPPPVTTCGDVVIMNTRIYFPVCNIVDMYFLSSLFFTSYYLSAGILVVGGCRWCLLLALATTICNRNSDLSIYSVIWDLLFVVVLLIFKFHCTIAMVCSYVLM